MGREPVVASDFHHSLAYWHEHVTGRPIRVLTLPYWIMWVVCYVVELFERATHIRVRGDLGMLTPAMLDIAQLSYVFSHAKAATKLGYQPLYTLDEALHRTVRQWRDLNRKHART